MNCLQKTRSFQNFQSAKTKILSSPKILEELLSASQLNFVMDSHEVEYRDRIFSPTTTLWIFLTQVLNSDHSCRAAIANYITTLKRKTCSLANSAYCQARKRLNVGVLKDLFGLQVKQLQARVPQSWLWKGRDVKLVDGTTLSMPDTADNQRHFPATNKSRNPNEFPIARLVVIICKTTGVLINAAIGTYQGKGSGETSLLKQLLPSFKPGDITVFDRYHAGFFSFSRLMSKGVDVVSRQHHLRKAQITKRLGKGDHLFLVRKPQKPKEMDAEEYQQYPDKILLRRVIINIEQEGFRVKRIEVITSLIDKKFLVDEIAELYRDRWFVEVDLRSIKSVMGMGILRCQTAEMIRKEIWVYCLAYNFVRAIVMDAALEHNLNPRSLSFKAALQLIFSYRNHMVLATDQEWEKLYLEILNHLKTQNINNRPNRYEPRLKKRRPNDKYLVGSRQKARLRLANRVA